MTQSFLLYQLRARLAMVQRRLNEATQVLPLAPGYLYAGGQLMELRSEQAFLLDLIGQMEQPTAPTALVEIDPAEVARLMEERHWLAEKFSQAGEAVTYVKH